jgi:hypothetical protein
VSPTTRVIHKTTRAPATNVNKYPRLTKASLAACSKKWRGILRLQDWDIELSINRVNQMMEGAIGQCGVEKTKRAAIIEIMCDVDAEMFGRFDWEAVLVHELLHLHFHDVLPSADWDSPTGIAAERTIDSLALTLVRLHRGE